MIIFNDKKQNSTAVKIKDSDPIILSEIKFNTLLKQAMKSGVLNINGQIIKRKKKIINFKTYRK